MSRAIRGRLIPAAAMLLAALPACRSETSRTSVVLITIDTLRAGNLSAYGYARPTSPRLEKLAEQGVLFENCYSAANVTNPSHISILTGTRVGKHGVRQNSQTFAAEGIPTLAERFRKAGYATAAVVSISHLDRAPSGLGRGFDAYFDAGTGERRAAQSVRLVRSWVQANASRPFFLWLHIFDPHMTYNPPPPYDARYVTQRSRRIDAILGRVDKSDVLQDANLAADEREALTRIFAMPSENVIGFNLLGLTPVELEYLPALYDGEIAYTDASLGELFDDLDRQNLSGRTIVAVTADHGEAFGEHGIYFSHRTVYEETLRVPLILRYPGRIPAAKRVGALVSGIDIAPTLLHYSGLPLGEGMDGRSLAPLIEGSAEAPSEPILADHAHGHAEMVRDGSWKLIISRTAQKVRRLERSGRPERSEQIERLRAIHPKRHELFNLAEDPAEKNDLASQHPETVKRLLALRRERLDGASRPSSPAVTDPAALERLRALGYDD
jgi:arylsulfatase